MKKNRKKSVIKQRKRKAKQARLLNEEKTKNLKIKVDKENN